LIIKPIFVEDIYAWMQEYVLGMEQCTQHADKMIMRVPRD